MDIEITLMLAAACVAVFIITLSVKLSRNRKGTPKSVPNETPPHDDDLFTQYKKLTAEQPMNPELWLKWGKALSAAASTAKHPNMRMHRYNEACTCFQRAAEINSGYITAWQNWGQTLYDLYKLQNNQDRLILDNAHTKFHVATRMAPADAALWRHWGEELYMAASYCQIQEQRQELQDLADAKFAKAVQLNPELMTEWKKWRGGSGAQDCITAFSSDSISPPLRTPYAATETNPPGENPANDAQPVEASLPWSNDPLTPVKASAWLTEGASPDSAPPEERDALSFPSVSDGKKP
ncbi:MAG: hypothetical protein LBD42_04875 [Desulfovibrio sp.]|nr:hypothetical protein [Desulfovibrio sp.]